MMDMTDENYLRGTILNAPIGICILNTETFVAELLNDKFLEVAGKPREDIIGHLYCGPFAGTKDYHEKALINVVKTGKAFYGDEVAVTLARQGKVINILINFVYVPVTDAYQNVCKIAVWALENANQLKARHEIDGLNKLSNKNIALHTANVSLTDLNTRLQESETDFKRLVEQAPVAIMVLRGPAMVIDIVNQDMLKILGRDTSIIGKPLLEGLPEIKGAPAANQLFEVYETGVAADGNEAPVPIKTDGIIETRYFNFSYRPLLDNGKVIGVMDVAVEVTAQVLVRKNLQSAYEQLRLSKEAAQLGFFDMDLIKGTLEWDTRCRELFGISHDNAVSYDPDFINGLHYEDRERILAIINDVFNKPVSNGVYDVEYRTVGAEDQKLRWVRAKGQAYFDDEDVPVRFIGSVIDITEQKQDEIRKNDFIGMVSHELKTPLTSLTAIIQVANLKLKNSHDPFLADAMDKATIQVKRMGNMINGFLNISRLESAKISIDKQGFDVGELIEEIVKETALTISSHKIKYQGCTDAFVKADRDKIGSVITNLVSNAIKYSPKASEIELTCEAIAKGVQFSVKDYGLGLNPKDAEKVFDRYFRVEHSDNKHISGFGIGLYLSAEIIHRHNGKIWVDSDEGKGSTFYFILPE